jgi:hypothetical protein
LHNYKIAITRAADDVRIWNDEIPIGTETGFNVALLGATPATSGSAGRARRKGNARERRCGDTQH